MDHGSGVKSETEVCRNDNYTGNLKKLVSCNCNFFQLDMVGCYWIFQFYHRLVRSCLFLANKNARIYAGYGI